MSNDDDRALLPFEQEGTWPVRRQWHDGQWYLSVIDVVRVLTDSPAPRQYWGMLKKRLHDEGADQPLTECVQLKMRSLDGKMRVTDAANQDNTPPEDLPTPTQSIQQLEKAEQQRLEAERQPSLFPEEPKPESGGDK